MIWFKLNALSFPCKWRQLYRSVKALRAQIVPNVPDQPHLGLPPHSSLPMDPGVYLSPALCYGLCLGSMAGVLVFSLAVPLPGHGPCWSRPVSWLSGLTACLQCHHRPAWWLLGSVWPWLPSTDLILTCGMSSCLDAGPVSLPQPCPTARTLCFPSTHRPALLAWGHGVSPACWGSCPAGSGTPLATGPREQLARAVPWVEDWS